MVLACVLLTLFSVVASTDSLYFHTWKYRLHTRPQSRHEHHLHTANICLFVPLVWVMFCHRPSGAWLAIAALLAAASLGVEIADVLCENDSRRDLGGVIPAEYLMHFLMSGLRGGFVFAFFAGVDASEFTAPATLGEVPLAQAIVAWTLMVPGVAVALLHLWLCRTPVAATGTAGAAA